MRQPLDGVRVLEYSQGIAAPIAARILAMHGAEVIKLESVNRPDITRQYGAPWLPPSTSSRLRMDTSPLVSEFLAGKLSVGLDLETPEGGNIMLDLIKESDILLINLSVGVVQKLGLGYDEVRALNPSIIYAALTGFGGSESPYRFHRAWGPNQSALSGIDHLTGWSDRPPSGVSSFALPDYTSAGHATIAILAALLYRDLTGVGQAIDMSQFESTVAALGHILLEESLGEKPRRLGSALAGSVLSGIYPCRGHEEWLALACESEEEVRRLAEVIPGMDPTQAPALADDHIADWARAHTSAAAALHLQAVGLAASPVADSLDLIIDEHLAERSFYRLAPQTRFGHDIFTGYPVTFSRTPISVERAGPALGEDTTDVLTRVLGMSEDVVRRQLEDGVAVGMTEPDVSFERPYWEWFQHVRTSPKVYDW